MGDYGYSRGGDDGGGGGFMGGSQGSQGASKSYAEESLRPVTIKQLLECEEAYPGADLAISGQQITQVTIVGQIRNINPQTTNISYKIDDGTGLIDVKKWIDSEREDAGPKFDVDQFVRVWGRVKIFNNKRHIGAHFLREIEDPDEINLHMLESTYCHLFFTKGMPQQAAGGGGGGDGGDSMFVDQGSQDSGDAKVARCSANARKVWGYLQNSPSGNEGVHVQQIATEASMSPRDVLSGASELLDKGLIYTTLNDETWAVMET